MIEMLTNAQRDLQENLKDPEFAMDFGAARARFELALLLTKARLKRGMTQEILAEKLAVSQPYLAKLERGEANPTISRIGSILAALGFKISAELEPLLAEETNEPKKVYAAGTLVRDRSRQK
jgi:transcriptional regulator with XRE-family HTH domain